MNGLIVAYWVTRVLEMLIPMMGLMLIPIAIGWGWLIWDAIQERKAKKTDDSK